MTSKPCSSCNRQLNLTRGSDGSDFVQLRPCKCLLCSRCAFKLVVNRKFGCVECTFHASTIEAVFFVESDRKSNGTVNEIMITQHEPDLARDPCRYYEKNFYKSKEEAQNKMVLSLSYANTTTKSEVAAPASITVELDRELGPVSDEDESNLRVVFGLFHDPIIKSHAELWKKLTFPRMTPSEFCQHMMYEDESLLLKLIYALATGEMQIPMKKIEVDKAFFSRFLACCVAKEMIQRLQVNKPGPFQLMMGDTLNIINAPSDLRNFLSKIRVAAHRITMDRESSKAALQSAKEKILLDPLEAFTLHFDNIGFKGRRAKWSQHTVIQICRIPYRALYAAGFYQGIHSRRRTTMDEYRARICRQAEEDHEFKISELVARRVVGVRKSDWGRLTKRVLTSIETAIKLPLPDLAACREYAEAGEGLCGLRIPLHLGNWITTPPKREDPSVAVGDFPLNGAIPDASIVDDAEDEQTKKFRSSPPTFYEANNMTLDNVLHEDPNAKKTVTKIADYLEEAAKYPDNFDRVKSGGERPVRDMFAAATSDGAPMKRWLDIKAEDLDKHGEADRTHKKATFFFGGFHFMMEFITMRGRLSRGIFGYFGRLWRPSLPQLNWILTASDPTEYLLEMPQYLLAHYRVAFECLRDSRRGDDVLPISPVDVHEYMLQRAVEIPTCMAHLFDLRLIELSFMIRDSEKSGAYGDIDLFLATMRLSLVLFTVTHATNYAHMTCDFLEWWELASDADKEFFKRWLYTKISPFGKPIWVDRGVEWTIRHIRMFLGKKARFNQRQRMEKVVPDVPFRMKAKKDLYNLLGFDRMDGSWTTDAWNDRTVRLSKVYFQTVTALYDTNLWGSGELEGALASDESSFRMVHTEEGGEEMAMSSSFLSAFDLGQQRAVDYYVEHHITNRGSVVRSEANVSLKLLPTTAAYRKADLEALTTIRLSVDPAKIEPLKRAFPMEKIQQELDELRTCLYPEIPEYSPSVKRGELVADLCKFRKLYFNDFPDVFESTKLSVEALDNEDAFTTPDARSKQIQSAIYSLDQDAINEFNTSRET